MSEGIDFFSNRKKDVNEIAKTTFKLEPKNKDTKEQKNYISYNLLNENTLSEISTDFEDGNDWKKEYNPTKAQNNQDVGNSNNTKDAKEIAQDALGLFGGTNGLLDWARKQNYAASTMMSQGFDLNSFQNINNSYSYLRESAQMGPQYVKSTKLNEKEEKEARLYALELIKKKLDEDTASLPDYGDCKKYYNEGSPADWVITHPTRFLLDYIAEKTGADWYKELNEYFRYDGEFTASPTNWIEYIENAAGYGNENGIRQDTLGRALSVRSNKRIEEELAQKYELYDKLNAAIDNPEEFAKLYYQITDGVNFSADLVTWYKNGNENNEATVPIETIVGRDYIKEDCAKNVMMTDMLFDINKTVGTGLLNMLPGGGFLAFGINVGLTFFDEKTKKNNDLSFGDSVKIIGREFARTLTISLPKLAKAEGSAYNQLEKLVENFAKSDGKTGVGKLVRKYLEKYGLAGIRYGTGEITENATNAVGDLVDGNFGSVASDVASAITTPSAIPKSIFMTTFKKIFNKILNR